MCLSLKGKASSWAGEEGAEGPSHRRRGRAGGSGSQRKLRHKTCLWLSFLLSPHEQQLQGVNIFGSPLETGTNVFAQCFA